MKRLVCGYEVSGSVENLEDGRVKLIIEGDEDELKAFLIAVGDSGLGPMLRRRRGLQCQSKRVSR